MEKRRLRKSKSPVPLSAEAQSTFRADILMDSPQRMVEAKGSGRNRLSSSDDTIALGAPTREPTTHHIRQKQISEHEPVAELQLLITQARKIRFASSAAAATLCVILIGCMVLAMRTGNLASVRNLLHPHSPIPQSLYITIVLVIVLMALTSSVALGTLLFEERAKRNA